MVSEKYIMLCLTSKRVLFLPRSDIYVRSLFYPFTLIEFLLHKALSD